MDEHDILLDDIIPFLKENYRIMGPAGIIVGTVLVIIYGSKINYYPSGMTISDTPLTAVTATGRAINKASVNARPIPSHKEDRAKISNTDSDSGITML